MHRLDGFVRPVTGRFRSEPGHDQCRQQCPGRGHQRNRPRTFEAGRPAAATLSDGGWDVIARKVPEQKFFRVLQREIEDNRSETGNDADRDAQQEPLAQVARLSDRCAEAAACGGGRGHCGLGFLFGLLAHNVRLTRDFGITVESAPRTKTSYDSQE